jgi:hypothetical protein
MLGARAAWSAPPADPDLYDSAFALTPDQLAKFKRAPTGATGGAQALMHETHKA